MSAQGAFKITEEFERLLCQYTGAPYAVAVDNCSNALFLALTWHRAAGKEITIPARTYPSVPCEVIHAGGTVRFSGLEDDGGHLTGAYRLKPLNVWDSALWFSADMFPILQARQPIAFHGEPNPCAVCLSFTGPYKQLKLGKGGAILTDSAEAAAWYKRARFSGRRECSYHDDDFDMLGWNFYLPVETAARGVHLMSEFLRADYRKTNPPLRLPFPDLSKCKVYGGEE